MSLILDHNSSASGFVARLVISAAHAFGRITSRLAAIIAAEIDRRETMALLNLEAHELKDIGLTRNDVEGALMTAPDAKPSFVLAAKRSEARRAERDQILEAQAAARS
jgi:uncharacterized protein YjiS (DUF1127 family)